MKEYGLRVVLDCAGCSYWLADVRRPLTPPSRQWSPRSPGSAFVLRADPSSGWLASWSEQTDGSFKLMVVNGDNGEQLDVDTAERPGRAVLDSRHGPSAVLQGRLQRQAEEHDGHLRHLRHGKAKASTNIRQINDMLETYQLDPHRRRRRLDGVRADDRHAAACPSFSIFSPTRTRCRQNAVSGQHRLGIRPEQRMASKLYWYLHDPKDGNFNIVSWSFQEEAITPTCSSSPPTAIPPTITRCSSWTARAAGPRRSYQRERPDAAALRLRLPRPEEPGDHPGAPAGGRRRGAVLRLEGPQRHALCADAKTPRRGVQHPGDRTAGTARAASCCAARTRSRWSITRRRRRPTFYTTVDDRDKKKPMT